MLSEYSITVEKLLAVVHSYTCPIRIHVVFNPLKCQDFDEAKNMNEFYLVEKFRSTDTQQKERLLKYYRNCPVWNLSVWHDFRPALNGGNSIVFGIEAHCHYSDIREGYLAEKNDIRREKQREYRKRKKAREMQTKNGGDQDEKQN